MLSGWLLEQKVIAAVGLGLWLFLLAAMLRTEAQITPRRAAALLTILAACGAIVWTLGGAVVYPRRAVTFIASCESATSALAPAVERSHPGGGALLVLYATDDSVSCRARAASLSIPRTRVQVVELGGHTNLAALLARAEAPSLARPFDAVRDALSVRSRVVLYDPAVPAWNAEFTKILESETEVFESDLFYINLADDSAALALEVIISGPVQPIAFNALTNPVALSLTGGRSASAASVALDLCVGVDKPVDTAPDCGSALKLKNLVLQRDPAAPVWRWQRSGPTNTLQDLVIDHCNVDCDPTVAAMRLSTGWHMLQFRAVVRSGTDRGKWVTPAHVAVNAQGAGPTVIVGASEPLAQLGWPGRTDAANPAYNGAGFASPMLATVEAQKPSTRFRMFPTAPPIPAGMAVAGPCHLRTDSDEKVLDACLNAAPAIVLVEPEASFLKQFAEGGRASELARRQVPVLVAGVPEIPAADATTAGTWLPAWPSPNTPVDRIARQVLIVADCSGLARIPIETNPEAFIAKGARRPSDVQNAVIDEFLALLNSMPNTESATVSTSPGGSKLVIRVEGLDRWVPAVVADMVPGCLRAARSPIELKTPRSLVDQANFLQRIAAFVPADEEIVSPFADLRPGKWRLPGSVLIVFTTRAAQIAPFTGATYRSGAATEGGGLTKDWIATKPPLDLLDALLHAGVRIVVAELPTNQAFEAAAAQAKTGVSETDWSSPAKATLVRIDPSDSPKKAAAAILSATGLNSLDPPIVQRHHFGRSLDPRIEERTEVGPQAVRPLTKTVPAARKLLTMTTSLGDVLLVAERNDNGAPVVTLAYSPFDIVAWASDIASDYLLEGNLVEATAGARKFAGLCPKPCPLKAWFDTFIRRVGSDKHALGLSSGLGVQRILDILDQATSIRRGPELHLLGLSLSASAERLIAKFALPSAGDPWSPPRILLADAARHCASQADASACPMILDAIDPGAGTATYAFSSISGVPAGTYPLVTAVPPETAEPVMVPFWLKPRTSLDPTAAPLLNTLRTLGAIPFRGELPRAVRSALPCASLVVAFLTFVLFSPLVRPWHALARLRRERHRRELNDPLDADMILELAGVVPSHYEASRRAGDPAWARGMQGGDSLSRAVIGDLALLTPIGRRVGAAMELPRVRLREIGESFDLVIGVDDAPAMLLPGDTAGRSRKRTVAGALIRVLSGSLAKHRGRCSVVGLRGEAQRLNLRGFSEDMVDEIIGELFAAGGSAAAIRDPPHLPTTAVRLLISDFLTDAPGTYAGWLRGSYAGAIHLADPRQADEIGTCRDVATGQIYDRSAWAPGDAAELLRRRAIESRHSVEDCGALFVSIRVDASEVEIAQVLAESGVLSLARRT